MSPAAVRWVQLRIQSSNRRIRCSNPTNPYLSYRTRAPIKQWIYLERELNSELGESVEWMCAVQARESSALIEEADERVISRANTAINLRAAPHTYGLV
jgi:hypothetical protein